MNRKLDVSPATEKFAQNWIRHLFAECQRNGYTAQDIKRITGASIRTQEKYRSVLNFSYPKITTVIALIRETEPVEALQELAAQAGCICFKLPEIDEIPTSEIYEEVSRLSKEFSKFVKEMADSTSEDSDDGFNISKREANRLKDRLQDLILEAHKADKALDVLIDKLS